MDTKNGFFIVQDSQNYDPFVVAWFRENLDAFQWVKDHQWVDLPGGGDPFGLSIVPNPNTPEPTP